jgi:putative transposase
MREVTEETNGSPAEEKPGEVLEVILKRGAQVLLQKAIEEEVEEFLARYKGEKGSDGLRMVVRNGYMPERRVLTGLGPIAVKQPRVDDRKLRKEKSEAGFTSRILPRYLRRIPSIDNLVPALYLKGVSTGAFPAALEAILGEQAPGLSATTVVRLKKIWEQEYGSWARRDLHDKQYVYFMGGWDSLQCPSGR